MDLAFLSTCRVLSKDLDDDEEEDVANDDNGNDDTKHTKKVTGELQDIEQCSEFNSIRWNLLSLLYVCKQRMLD